MTLANLIRALEGASIAADGSVNLTHPIVSDALSYLRAIQDARGYDAALDADERAPTGDDYSIIFDFIGSDDAPEHHYRDKAEHDAMDKVMREE